MSEYKKYFSKKIISYVKFFIYGIFNQKKCYKYSILNIDEVDEVKCFCLSFNNVIIYKKNNKKFYFKKCNYHIKEKDYFLNEIDDFFYFLENKLFVVEGNQKPYLNLEYNQKNIKDFKKYIYIKINDKKSIKKIENIDIFLDIKNYNPWRKNSNEVDKNYFSFLEMDDIDASLIDLLLLFLQYMRPVCYNYKMNWRCKKEDLEMYFASKSFSSKKIADFLDVGYTIVDANFVKLNINGKEYAGLATPEIIGIRGIDFKGKLIPEMQRGLNDLLYLDLITNQCDHYLNNYFILDNNYENICAFDNDNQYTFFPSFNIKKIASRINISLYNKDKKLILFYISKKLYKKIINVSYVELKLLLKNDLNKLQIVSMYIRINKIKKILKNSNNNIMILDDNQWNEKTIEYDICNSKSYFKILYDNAIKR